MKNAHLFIDYMLRAEVAAKNSNFISFANSNAASWPLVNAEVKNNPGIFPTPEMMPKLVPDLPESAGVHSHADAHLDALPHRQMILCGRRLGSGGRFLRGSFATGVCHASGGTTRRQEQDQERAVA